MLSWENAVHFKVMRAKSANRILSVLFGSLLSLSLQIQPAAATPITGTPSSGLSNPSTVIDFEEGAIAAQSSITTDFTGVTFGSGFALFDGGAVVDNNLTGRILFSDNNFFPPVYSMLFDENVLAAGFHFIANEDTTTTFQAFLSGSLVDQFALVADRSRGEDNFFGFEGILLDEIRFSITEVGFVLDNLQFVTAVPLPATLPLYGTGLAIMGFIGWRRKHSVAK